MIQRIQSVYLLLGAFCLAALGLFDSVWQNQAAETLAWFVPALAILGAATVAVALISIFLYKNRRKQVKVVTAAQVMTVAFMIVLFGGLFLAGDLEFLAQAGDDLWALLVLLLPVVSYIFFYLARRAIQRDIDLVKSMDRLR